MMNPNPPVTINETGFASIATTAFAINTADCLAICIDLCKANCIDLVAVAVAFDCLKTVTLFW